MTPVYQTIFTPPDGNCLQASIASIFELSLDEVPNFSLAREDWYKSYQEWLKDFGLYVVYLECSQGFTPQGIHLITGTSPRNTKIDHCVVGLNGKVIHDPYPNAFIPYLVKTLIYDIFVPLNVTTPISRTYRLLRACTYAL